MGVFEVVSRPGPRLSEETVREVGGAFASFVDGDSPSPFHEAMTELLAEPLDGSQLLNCVVGLSNVVGLLVLTLAQDEESAASLSRGVIAKAAGASVSGVFKDAEDPLHASTQEWICRVYGLADVDAFPDEIDGKQLVALAAYGDAAVVLADRVGIPRAVLGPALASAASRM